MSPVFYASYISLWILLIVQGVLLLLVYRHFGLIVLGGIEGIQRDGLPIGKPAPSITGITPSGSEIQWTPARGRSTLLVFASPSCEPCAKILPSINQLSYASNNHASLEVAAVVAGPITAVTELNEKFQLRCLSFADDGSGAFKQYGVRVTPFAFVIGPDGLIQSKGLCSDPFRLNDLLTEGGVGAALGALQTNNGQMRQGDDPAISVVR